MRKLLLDILQCQACKKNSMYLKATTEDAIEIRRGEIVCSNCNKSYDIKEGIVDFLKDPGVDIKKEQKAMEDEEYLWDDKGNRFRISKDTIDRFRDKFLLLPEGDGSYFFKRGGCFQSIAEASHRFYDTLNQLGLKGKERVLALGDGFGYASYKFAKFGCNVITLDISNYLAVSDLYIKDAYFERVFGDMHDLPFIEGTFDIIFCAAAMHHSKKIKDVFFEISRVLKPGGRAVIINECARGIFEKNNQLFDKLKDKGYGDSVYTIPEWREAAISVGFTNVRIEYLSLAKDYIIRQENRNAEPSVLLSLAYFFRKHQWLEKIILFLLIYPRILFRPKSWRIVCYK